MLVFPQWRPEIQEGCRAQRWMPVERFAPYLARPVLPPLPPQLDDEDSLGGSSPERSPSVDAADGVCGWQSCGVRFQSVARLSAHIARVHAHAHRDGLFYCGWKGCSRPQRGFNARYKMLVHVRTHTNERPHVCNQCNKSFSRAENLKIHLRSHSGEKPYVCPYEGCGKAYSNSSDRFKHTRTHTVDKPYCCKIPGCNKRYTDPSSLRKHVKTYKHFTFEESAKRESSDECQDIDFSPSRDHYVTEPTSPLHGCFTYTNQSTPPSNIPYKSALPLPDRTHSVNYVPLVDQVMYGRPVEAVYPVRVPTHEMSYLEYTQMYEHAYKNYYSNSITYPFLRTNEKVYTFEDQSPDAPENVKAAESSLYSTLQEMPLNLICTKRMECKPLDELIKFTDLPLDLSTKS